MDITVTNSGKKLIEVAINVWGNSGSSSSYRIESGASDTWGRNDIRGYVMTILHQAVMLSYFVLPEDEVVFKDGVVTINGTIVKPLKTLNESEISKLKIGYTDNK